MNTFSPITEEDISLDGRLIQKLLRQFHMTLKPESRKSLWPHGVSDFMRGQEGLSRNILREVGRNVVRNSKLKSFSNLDVECIVMGAFDAIFRPRRKDNKVNLHYYNDGYLAGVDSIWVTVDSFADANQIMKSKGLHPDVSVLIKRALVEAYNKHLENEWGFSIVINSRILADEIQVNIQDRIFINFTQSKLEIVGKYHGSPIVSHNNMNWDLGLIFALLEFDSAISKPRDGSHVPNPGDLALTFNFPKHKKPISFAYLEDNYKKHSADFIVHQIVGVPPDRFKLLNFDFKNPILKTAVHYFHTDSYPLTAFHFLRYWTAIEIMLGSPEDKIGNVLEKNFYKALPDAKSGTFEKLWRVRGEVVHRGRLDVDTLTTHEVQWQAKNLFNHFFWEAIEDEKSKSPKVARMTGK